MKHLYTRKLWLVVTALLLSNTAQAQQAREELSEMTCEADGTCTTSIKEAQVQTEEPANLSPQESFSVKVVNKSKYQVDVYWDDGRFGKKISSLDARVGTGTFNTFEGHSFFVTRHGVRELLYDVKADQQHRFTAATPEDIFVIPKLAAPSPHKCRDRFSSCPEEAARNECLGTPGWMIVHCCQSCNQYLDAERLIDPKERCTKEHLNMTKSAWEPGDLNTLFESWATNKNDAFQQYEPQILSSPDAAFGGKNGPWVVVFDNFFSSDEADALVRGGALEGFERSTDQGQMNALGEQERVTSKSRTSSNAWCRNQCEALPEVNAMTARIEQVTGVPRTNYESFQILEYGEEQFYRMHHDSSSQNKKKIAGPRILTFFLYLSDVEEGGETYFNKLDLAVQPKKGRALIWPSVTNDDPESWDDRMYHEAKPVIRGKKYAANHWIHLNNYITPNEWGCTGSFG